MGTKVNVLEFNLYISLSLQLFELRNKITHSSVIIIHYMNYCSIEREILEISTYLLIF